MAHSLWIYAAYDGCAVHLFRRYTKKVIREVLYSAHRPEPQLLDAPELQMNPGSQHCGSRRRSRLPRHDRSPVPGGNRSAASCLCTVLRRALYHYATRSPNKQRKKQTSKPTTTHKSAPPLSVTESAIAASASKVQPAMVERVSPFVVERLQRDRQLCITKMLEGRTGQQP